MSNRLCWSALAALLASTAVAADKPAAAAAPAAPAVAPSPQARDLARVMLDEKQFGQMLDGYAARLTQQVGFGLSHAGAEVPKDLQAKLRGDLGKSVTYAEVTDIQAVALARRFSGDELNGLVAFYRAPLGQKMLQEFPAVSEEIGRGIDGVLSAKAAPLMDKYVPKGKPAGMPPNHGKAAPTPAPAPKK